MLKAKEIIIFLPGDGEKEVFKNVEFQSNPEAGLLAIFKNDGKESLMFSVERRLKSKRRFVMFDYNILMKVMEI